MSSKCSYQKFELIVQRTNLVGGAFEVVKQLRSEWSFDKMKFQIFIGGITNQLIGVYQNDDHSDTILVRVYGENTEQVIDRENEIKIMQLLYPLGLSSKIYAAFTNGLIYQYLVGRTLDEKSCYDPNIYPLVAQKMAEIHLQLPVYKTFSDGIDRAILWDKIKCFIVSGCEEKLTNLIKKQSLPSKSKLIEELEWLKSHLEKFNSPLVLCHNDLLLANVLYDEKSKTVHFIDFEYAGPNYRSYDIANHFNEFSGGSSWSSYPNENFRREWLQAYLRVFDNIQHVEEKKLQQVMDEIEHFRLASHFFCGTWGVYQATHSTLDFDFVGYSVSRFDEYYRIKRILLPFNLVESLD
ncbi:ethanolamine kinase 1-like [Daphnia carinata]|uniref:ethanolamine kinase 1-like n=1 Tax=Daphnia carinata TaxID=120202 RepID=UPI00257FC73F|nr:ethanolamine kinase 1-like [Daphnia carinata]